MFNLGLIFFHLFLNVRFWRLIYWLIKDFIVVAFNFRFRNCWLSLNIFQLFLHLFREFAVMGDKLPWVNLRKMMLKRRVTTILIVAETTVKWFELHMNTLCMIFQVRNWLKRFITVCILALKGSIIVWMCEHVIFEMLLLLKWLVTAFESAFELALVTS